MWGLHAPLPAEHDHYAVVLILAFYDDGRVLFVDGGGELRVDTVVHFKLEWRFNWNTHTWEDQDSGDLYDEASDGGSEIPGDFPDPDGADGGHPSDEGDGETGGLDPK